jgi:hypothetical protein
VFINKKGRKITWYYSEKMSQLPPNQPDDDQYDSENDLTDEDDLESQESQGWLESGHPPPNSQQKPASAGPSNSNMQGKTKCSSPEVPMDGPPNLFQELEILVRSLNQSDGNPSASQVLPAASLCKGGLGMPGSPQKSADDLARLPFVDIS